MNKKVWLIGAGGMAQDYIKVLQELKQDFIVISRGIENAEKCKKTTGCEIQIGGLEEFLASNPQVCTHAIVAVGIEKLYEITVQLLNYGVKNILVEKPGALYNWQFIKLDELVKKQNANVIIAYNRRFYASVLKAQELIEKDNGVTSFNFEFTEWASVIKPLKKEDGVKENWLVGNSTHVIDLAFYLGGKPKEISSYTSGKLDWHPSASIFSGSGVSEKGALFSYQANWESAGRWMIEILTKEHRFIFKPLEKLQIQKRGSIIQEFDESVNYCLDEKYKPGLYVQTKNFLDDALAGMCILEEQVNIINIYNKMANYDE